MRIVNTFISDGGALPPYTKICLEKARKTNPEIKIDFICKDEQSFFKELNIQWVPQESLENGHLLNSFNQVCKFRRHGTPNTTYPSPELFWHRTAERIFYLDEYLSQNQIDDVVHFENDVLIYYSLDLIDKSDKISITDMSNTHTTFAFCHIPKWSLLSELCGFFNKALSFGENKLMTLGYDHISEMSLLNIALKNKMVTSFPTLKNITGTFVYDPGSYGQYFGGTNNGHGVGFVDPSHHIGKAIMTREIIPTFENSKPQTEHNMIFNLHVHSKNLERFI